MSMGERCLDIGGYFVAVILWEWLLGKFVDLEFSIYWGWWDVLCAGVGLFVADVLAATIPSGSNRKIVIVLLILYFIADVISNFWDADLLSCIIMDCDVMIMIAAAVFVDSHS